MEPDEYEEKFKNLSMRISEINAKILSLEERLLDLMDIFMEKK